MLDGGRRRRVEVGGIRRGLVGGVVLLVGRVSRSKVDMRDTSSHSLDLRDGLKGLIDG